MLQLMELLKRQFLPFYYPNEVSSRGVMLLGKIIETQGSGEGFGVAFVEKNEVWYLENAGGHQWLAVRVPDNAYFVGTNQSRLGKVDLKDSKITLLHQI